MIGVCFHSSSPLDLWERIGIDKIEKSKIARLTKSSTRDLLIINNRWPNTEKEQKNLQQMKQLYAPGAYALVTALFVKFYAYIYLGKNIPISLRLGYMPDILHLKNKRLYAATKAMILILLAIVFCKYIFSISSFKGHWLLKLRKNIIWIDQKVCKNIVHKMPLDFHIRTIDLLFCGRLEEEKGICTFLNLNFSTKKIVVVGGGTFSNQVNKKFKKNYYRSRSQEELSVLYANTKYLINLSPSEGSPKVVLEALLNGCKVIALKDSFEAFSGFENEIIFIKSTKEINKIINQDNNDGFKNTIRTKPKTDKNLIMKYTV
jgi:glycosyltransferase involved in cell wall biosynthesis